MKMKLRKLGTQIDRGGRLPFAKTHMMGFRKIHVP